MWPQQTDTQKITTSYHWRRTLNLRRKEENSTRPESEERERWTTTKKEEKKRVEQERMRLFWFDFIHIHSANNTQQWIHRWPKQPKSCRRRLYIFFSSFLLLLLSLSPCRSLTLARLALDVVVGFYTVEESEKERIDDGEEKGTAPKSWRTSAAARTVVLRGSRTRSQPGRV